MHLAQTSGLQHVMGVAGAYRARVCLAQGTLGSATVWMAELARLEIGETPQESEDLLVARIFLACGGSRRAIALVQRVDVVAKLLT